MGHFNWPWHQLEVCGQLHAPDTLPPGNEPPEPIGWGARWAPEPVWTIKNLVALTVRLNCTDWATITGWRILVPTFPGIEVSRGQRGGSSTVVNISFLDWSRWLFFQVAPHLSSRGGKVKILTLPRLELRSDIPQASSFSLYRLTSAEFA
jgi:hypothetical protein